MRKIVLMILSTLSLMSFEVGAFAYGDVSIERVHQVLDAGFSLIKLQEASKCLIEMNEQMSVEAGAVSREMDDDVQTMIQVVRETMTSFDDNDRVYVNIGKLKLRMGIFNAKLSRIGALLGHERTDDVRQVFERLKTVYASTKSITDGMSL